MRRWRLIRDEPSDGAWNMAVDEAILETGCRGPVAMPPTLRLYGWSPPALSLGREQPAEGAANLDWLLDAGVDLVRRPTGGRAVLHEDERTYAVVARLRGPDFPGGVVDTYARIAAALAAALRRLGVDARSTPGGAGFGTGPLGPPACFDRPVGHEIAVGGKKVVGSSQLRRRRAFLQHGSILIRTSACRLSAAVGDSVDASTFAGLAEVGPGPVSPAALDEALVDGFAEAFGVDLLPGGLTDEEAALAARLRCWKYDSSAWTLGGRVGEREARWGGPLPG